jgi:hypothetical protein
MQEIAACDLDYGCLPLSRRIQQLCRAMDCLANPVVGAAAA